jgi:hypothetical protein
LTTLLSAPLLEVKVTPPALGATLIAAAELRLFATQTGVLL